jgi:integrase/recombinase XerD
VLDDNYLPVQSITSFLSYLDSLERSPNTLCAYAYHLKTYWEFLRAYSLEWSQVGLSELSEFIAWLRTSRSSDLSSVNGRTTYRAESSVNTILAAVSKFYDYHARLGNVREIPLQGINRSPVRNYKSLLHGIGKLRPIKTKILKLRQTKRAPQTLSAGDVEKLISACHTLRDKFLLCLLYETGMRIGQALGLRHEDIKVREQTVWVIPRVSNTSRARAKSRQSYPIDVPANLMEVYIDYLSIEYGRIQSDFVFINLWNEPLGRPMTYKGVDNLFRSLRKRTGVLVTPHVLRHTHATELMLAKWDPAFVQHRLGHASVQTTINTYVHIPRESLKHAYKDFLEKMGRK